ncbi:GlcG/HbpS family heme-binding protein [Rhodoplanes azumiensis]|uniref:Heme-binding protein n=1 Tax=Rhodoplanes azumiensis TaxID=1897628 RepID=A0ABW5AM56_9BRAD
MNPASHTASYTASAKRLTNAGARKILETALEKARAAGIQVAVAIVDGGGNLLLLERMDTARFHLVHSSTTKARCCASNKRPTTSKGAVAQPLDVAHALGLALAAGPENWTAMEGGCPIIVDGECVGGVGVSGGSWDMDAQIAEEAVRSIGASVSIDGK